MKITKTIRGFDIIDFIDRYNSECSIQKSSLATDDCIWFGINDANPKIMASKIQEGAVGWIPYHIPKDVSLTTRMHLNRDQVKNLLPILRLFVETGEIVNDTRN